MTDVGFREYLDIKRPEKSIIELFREIPVSNIDDNMNRLYAVSANIIPFNNSPLLGSAFTVKVPAGDNLMFHRALDLAEPGDILVIDGAGWVERALCGEIMVQYAMKRGLGGFIIDGCIRDVDRIAKLSFPVYAKGVSPNGPYKNGPGEINVPISIGGIVVIPGDIIVGDADGVVVIRQADALSIAQKAKMQNAREKIDMQAINSTNLDRSWVKKLLNEKGLNTSK